MPHETVDSEKVIAYLGLGSSLGDRVRHLKEAISRIREIHETILTGISSVYETPHMGMKAEDAQRYPPHLNCAVEVKTSLSAMTMLEELQQIELADGREHFETWGPRTIDIDILLYGQEIMQTAVLTLPHTGILKRTFVLTPLAEIAPEVQVSPGLTAREAVNKPDISRQKIQRIGENELLL